MGGSVPAALAETGNIVAAARAAGVNHNTAHKRRQRNATFRFAMERALDSFRASGAVHQLAAEASGDRLSAKPSGRMSPTQHIR